MVTETEAMVCNRSVPAGGVPAKVNGIETVNWPPKPWDAVLSNQAVAAWVRSTDTCVPVRLNPAAAVNCAFRVVNDRVVE